MSYLAPAYLNYFNLTVRHYTILKCLPKVKMREYVDVALSIKEKTNDIWRDGNKTFHYIHLTIKYSTFVSPLLLTFQ